MANCIISQNRANRGGGAYVTIYVDSHVTIANCGIIGNFAADIGGGILSDVFEENSAVTNCILWANRPDQVAEADLRGSASLSYSNVQGGWSGLGNIDVDPCFVEPGKWVDANDPNIVVEPNDPNAVWVDGDYHLKSEGWYWHTGRKVWTWDEDVTSRCIDAGNPGSPLGDEPLSVPPDPNNEWGENLRINMGAYGGTAEASMPPYDWALLSDITNDGTVDFIDFAHLANLYTDQDEQLPADFDRDGDVDYADLHLLTQDWLKATIWHE